MIVANFGGTSVADAPTILRLSAIFAGDPDIGVVVVSALAGVTDQLIACGRLAGAGDAHERHTMALPLASAT